jgi:hypothetical protein
LEVLSKFVIVTYFVGNKHSSLYIVKGCELLYVCKFAILTWLNWFKNNWHLGYKCTTIDFKFNK